MGFRRAWAQAQAAADGDPGVQGIALGKRRLIGVSRTGQDGPPFSAMQVAENAGKRKPRFSLPVPILERHGQ
jgi:hypothetical protein